MRLTRCKLANPKESFATENYVYALKSHKFEVDINDVFGEAFNPPDVNTWLSDKPNSVFDWTIPPYDTMYIEYCNLKMLPKSERLGMLLFDQGLTVVIVPFMLNKTKVRQVPYLIDLSLCGELTEADFDDSVDYVNWLNMPWNTTKRFNVSTINEAFWDPEIAGAMASVIPVLLETLLYINAKGVGTTTNRAKVKLNNKYKRALPDNEYKTLRIIRKDEPKNIINKSINRRVPFVVHSSREHTVMGHMAIYTSEKPLFGNPKNVGPIWISPHTRCKGTKGKIVKDYKVC